MKKPSKHFQFSSLEQCLNDHAIIARTDPSGKMTYVNVTFVKLVVMKKKSF